LSGDKKRFCEKPYTTAEIGLGGEVFPCHPSWVTFPLGNLQTGSLGEIWDGPQARDYRRTVHDGSLRFCLDARCQESLNGALASHEYLEGRTLPDAFTKEYVVLDRLPSRLVLSYDPSCGLACPACRSKPFRMEEPRRVAELSRITDKVLAAIGSRQGLETLVIAGQGEPFDSPQYRRILTHLASKSCGPLKIEIQTNGLGLTEAAWREFEGLEKYDLSIEVSLDADWSWSYIQLRRPADWDLVLANLEFIAGLRRAGRIRAFHLSMTVQADNYFQIPGFALRGQKLGCDEVRFRPLMDLSPHLGMTFAARNILNGEHPEHKILLEVLRHPILTEPFCHLEHLNKTFQVAIDTPSADLPLIDKYTEEKLEPELYLALAQYMRNNQQFDTPLALIIAGLRRWPDFMPFWAVMAGIYLECGRASRAADLMYRFLTLPGGRVILPQLCETLNAAGRTDELLALTRLSNQ